jgi:hypothetical protein
MSSSKSDFSQYHRIVSQLASRGLSGLSGQSDPEGEQRGQAGENPSDSVGDWPKPWPLEVALPVAKLLVEPATDLACLGLINGFRQLAKAGRQLAVNKTLPTFFRNMGDMESSGHGGKLGGHPLYLPLVVHLHLAAFTKLYEQMPMSFWSRCEDSLVELADLIRPADRYTKAQSQPGGSNSDITDASDMPVVIWQALCLLEYAQLSLRDVDVELVDSVVHKLVTVGGTGPFQPLLQGQLAGNTADQAAWRLGEQAGLHALANLALLRRNRRWADRVQEIAQWHIDHPPPPEAPEAPESGSESLQGQSSQSGDLTGPWALFAHFWSRQTRDHVIKMIEQLEAQASLDCLSALLLADAAHAFSLFE